MITVALFDSGFGGLTVAREVKGLMPYANIEYFGDNARAPYGSRSHDEIVSLTVQCADFLAGKKPDILIIACNTATVAALEHIADRYLFPVIGVIQPGAEAALAATKNKRVGVLGTQFTIESGAHMKALTAMDPELKVAGKACPSFCPLVEAGLADSAQTERDAAEYLSVFKGSEIDTLVLACTHYPLLSDQIRRNLPGGVAPEVTFVDPAVETVKRAISVLKARGFAIPSAADAVDVSPRYRFYTTGDPLNFERLGSQFFGSPTGKVEKVVFSVDEGPR